MDLYSFLTQYDATLNLVIENEFPGTRCVGGKYSADKHLITLYRKDIEIQCERLLGSLDRLEEYTWIVFAHEVGHALDLELPSLSGELSITNNMETLYKIEVNAWDIAEKLVPFIDRELVQKVRAESLAHCFNRPLVS
ncbi:hypothetical protein [Peribacillus glennii]|uniref:Uncharacterized protein n=1 Tax=Peribacillus glennii TaxID=2303991 RepID=A0A372L9D1_9BACI|nr:hypothetical protein [Peribacillus glennii]RFU62107.1 hypothetical protein D0466_16120 [Peribacillus glennii]